MILISVLYCQQIGIRRDGYESPKTRYVMWKLNKYQNIKLILVFLFSSLSRIPYVFILHRVRFYRLYCIRIFIISVLKIRVIIRLILRNCSVFERCVPFSNRIPFSPKYIEDRVTFLSLFCFFYFLKTTSRILREFSLWLFFFKCSGQMVTNKSVE